jgi:uncharacterized protein
MIHSQARLWAAAALAWAIGMTPLHAFTIEKNPPIDPAAAYRELIPAAPVGAVSWETLEKTTVAVDESSKDGVARPRFPDEIAALDGKEIRVKGYVFPLDQAVRLSRFLLTAYPPDCPFCLPAGATQMIFVECARPLESPKDAVVVAGRLQLLRNTSDGLLYKMSGARFEKE